MVVCGSAGLAIVELDTVEGPDDCFFFPNQFIMLRSNLGARKKRDCTLLEKSSCGRCGASRVVAADSRSDKFMFPENLFHEKRHHGSWLFVVTAEVIPRHILT